jgi:hypothetical protein
MYAISDNRHDSKNQVCAMNPKSLGSISTAPEFLKKTGDKIDTVNLADSPTPPKKNHTHKTEITRE